MEFPDQGELRGYINEQIEKCGVATDAFFGFGDPDLPPDKQRVGGFGFRRFANYDDLKKHEKTGREASDRKKHKTLRPQLVSTTARFAVNKDVRHPQGAPLGRMTRQTRL